MIRSGFIYCWIDLRYRESTIHPWLCIGSHIGRENDNYTTSNRRCRSAIKKRPEDFKREILTRIWFITKDYPNSKNSNHPVRIAEQRYLDLIPNEELGVKYYNLMKNAVGGAQIHPDIIEKLRNGAIRLNFKLTPEEKSINSRKGGLASTLEKDTNGKSINARNAGFASRNSFTSEERSVRASKAGILAHRLKDEEGKSIHGRRRGRAMATIIHLKKDERGKSLVGIRLGISSAAIKDERGKSIIGVRSGKLGGPKSFKLKVGIHGRTKDQMKLDAFKGNHIRWHVKRNKIDILCNLCNNQFVDLVNFEIT